MTRSYTLRLSAELDHSSEGTVQLYAEVRIHPDLQSLTLSFPDYLAPETTKGFTQSQRHQCEWDGTTDHPWIRFQYDVNQTNTNGYKFVDTGGWAVLKYPPIKTSWRHSGQTVDLTQEYDIRQEGIISSDGSIVYLGPHEEEQFSAGGQEFRLALPSETSLAASVSDVQASLSYAAKALDFGGKSDVVVIVVVPSRINWGSRGLQRGSNGFWVVDSTKIDDANNTWIHEYVHTRQEWTQDSSTRWLIEGTTTYYAALLTYLNGQIPFSAFHRYLITDLHSESVLVSPNQWTAPIAHYTKGRRVTAALDATIRRKTDGERTFADVFRQMNQINDPLTHEIFKRLVRDVVGQDLNGWLSTYVEGAAVPQVPDDKELFSNGTAPSPDTETEDETTPDSESEQCPVCGNTVNTDREFCDACGTALFRQCPVCGRGVAGEAYCPECGTEVEMNCEVCGNLRRGSEEFCSNCGTRFR